MTQKFGRNFRLTIDPSDGLPPIVITLPYTIQFWVERDTLASLNQFSVEIYNLSKATRRRIFQDRWDLRPNQVNGASQPPRTAMLEIGYATLYNVAQGQLWQASSSRRGTDIVTRIEGRSAFSDLVTAQITESYQAGNSIIGLFNHLIGQFPNLTPGVTLNPTTWPQTFNRPVALNGLVWDEIKKYSKNNVYIDNGKVYIMKQNDVLDMPALLLNDQTGIIDTPRRFQGRIVVTTLLEPIASISQTAQLNSSIEPVYDGTYSIAGLRHEGIISEAVAGSARSTISLLQPQFVSYNTPLAPA